MINRDLHLRYFHMNLESLPHHYTSNETIRMTLGMFCLSALEMLGDLSSFSEETKQDWIEWIYQQQHSTAKYAGFSGAPFLNLDKTELNEYDLPHLTMTYSAIISLLILGDDLSRANKDGIIKTLRTLQQDDGSFCPVPGSDETDMRFVYCACAVAFIFNDFSGFDTAKTADYIKRCQNFDGGFGIKQLSESHGGTTYCAIASLALLNKLQEFEKTRIVHWLVSRQDQGFHGRVNKPDDTCYAYWICGSLKVTTFNPRFSNLLA